MSFTFRKLLPLACEEVYIVPPEDFKPDGEDDSFECGSQAHLICCVPADLAQSRSRLVDFPRFREEGNTIIKTRGEFTKKLDEDSNESDDDSDEDVDVNASGQLAVAHVLPLPMTTNVKLQFVLTP